MDVQQLQQLKPELDGFLQRYLPHFRTAEGRGHAGRFVQGLLLGGDRPSVETAAAWRTSPKPSLATWFARCRSSSSPLPRPLPTCSPSYGAMSPVIAGAITRAFTFLEKGRPAEDDYGRRLVYFFASHIKAFISASMLPTKDIAAIARESDGSDVAPALAYIQEHLAAHGGAPQG